MPKLPDPTRDTGSDIERFPLSCTCLQRGLTDQEVTVITPSTREPPGRKGLLTKFFIVLGNCTYSGSSQVSTRKYWKTTSSEQCPYGLLSVRKARFQPALLKSLPLTWVGSGLTKLFLQ